MPRSDGAGLDDGDGIGGFGSGEVHLFDDVGFGHEIGLDEPGFDLHWNGCGFVCYFVD